MSYSQLSSFLVPDGAAAAGHGVQAADGFFCGVGAPSLL